MDDTQAAREALIVAVTRCIDMEDKQTAREALARQLYEAFQERFRGMIPDSKKWDNIHYASVKSRWMEIADVMLHSIPAAAALLREAGWLVEEPKCETCGGFKWIGGGYGDLGSPCPTCNGTGKRA